MKTISRTLALTRMFLSPTLRSPMMTVLVSLLPVSMILIFGLVGGAKLSLHALYGTLVVFSANVGIVSLPQLAINYQIRNIRSIFVASPVGPVMYAAGMGLSRLCWVAPGILIILGVLVGTGALPLLNVPTVITVIVVTWFTGVLIGFTISTLLPDPYLIGSVSNLVGTLFSVLPPIYYPMELLPGWAKVIAMVLPTTNAAQLIRIAGGMAEASTPMILLHWAILLTYAVVCAVITIRKARWMEV